MNPTSFDHRATPEHAATPDHATSPDYPAVLALYHRHLSRGRAKISEVFGTQMEVSGQGAWVRTSDGARYLNAGGYGVLIHGSRHPHVEAAVIRQIRTHPVATRILLEPTVAQAAQALARVAPDGLERVYFASSGTEATEAAIKLARMHGRRRLVSATGGYHGKTIGSLTVTANTLYQDPFRPLLSQVSHVRFGDAQALAADLATGEPACVILEPVQGEGGVQIPPPGYLRQVRDLCTEHGAIFVLDEIQTGLGRLGTWWGADRDGVSPDILLAGKGLSGGIVPVSAMVATAPIFRPFDKDPFIHTSTFSGAPIAMAAARAAVEAIEADGLVERSALLGSVLVQGLRDIARRRCPGLVSEVRGVGLLIGVEMAHPGLAGELISEMINQHVIVNYSLNASAVVRLTPPAVLSQDDVQFLLTAFDAACVEIALRYSTSGQGQFTTDTEGAA